LNQSRLVERATAVMRVTNLPTTATTAEAPAKRGSK